MKKTILALMMMGGGLSTQAATYIVSGTVDFSTEANWKDGKIPDGFPIKADADGNRTFSGCINFSQPNIEWTINGKFRIEGVGTEGDGHSDIGLYFNSAGKNNPTVRLNFGETGMLSLKKNISFSQQAQGSAESLFITANLVGGTTGAVTTRILMESADIWNKEAISNHKADKTFSFAGFRVHEEVLTSMPIDGNLLDGVAYVVATDDYRKVSVVYKAGTGSVPEPTTATLGLLGVAGLLLRRRRI